MLKIIIPTFPRSGTSFLAGLLTRMGFSAGPENMLKKGDQYNPFGYFECLPIMTINRNILAKFGGHIVNRIPELPADWVDVVKEDKKWIKKFIIENKIEIIKDPHLLVLADMYDELFPDARWIVINRNIHETYKSRFGRKMSFDEWKILTEKRMIKWMGSRPYQQALKLDYNDFFVDITDTIQKIVEFLRIELTEMQWEECISFFRPKSR